MFWKQLCRIWIRSKNRLNFKATATRQNKDFTENCNRNNQWLRAVAPPFYEDIFNRDGITGYDWKISILPFGEWNSMNNFIIFPAGENFDKATLLNSIEFNSSFLVSAATNFFDHIIYFHHKRSHEFFRPYNIFSP